LTNAAQVPGEVLISTEKGKSIEQLEAYTAVDRFWTNEGRTTEKAQVSIRVSSWSFDGDFHKVITTLRIDRLPSNVFPGDEIEIPDLVVYPMKFAEPEVVEAMRTRGQMFWKCRDHHYVCYKGLIGDRIQSMVSDARFVSNDPQIDT
jgi:hypothetical protein